MKQKLNKLYPYWKTSTLIESIYNAAYHNRYGHVYYMIDHFDRPSSYKSLEDIYVALMNVLYHFSLDELGCRIYKEYSEYIHTISADNGCNMYKYPVAVYYIWMSNHELRETYLRLCLSYYRNDIRDIVGYLSKDMHIYAVNYISNSSLLDTNIFYYLNRMENKIEHERYSSSVEPEIFSFERKTYYQLSNTYDSRIPLLHPKFSVLRAMNLAKRICL